MSERELLRAAADYAADFLDSLGDRPIRAEADVEELYDALGGPLPEEGLDDRGVLASLVESVEPGLVGIPSGRYFGFVIGGAVPAALAADWMTSAWDQNSGLYAGGPSAAVAEEVARGWLVELLGLPAGASAAFVTGCQMAHVTALMFSSKRGGMSRRTGSSARRRSVSWSARSGMSLSTVLSACSASARRRSPSSPLTIKAACASASFPVSGTCRQSSVGKQAK